MNMEQKLSKGLNDNMWRHTRKCEVRKQASLKGISDESYRLPVIQINPSNVHLSICPYDKTFIECLLEFTEGVLLDESGAQEETLDRGFDQDGLSREPRNGASSLRERTGEKGFCGWYQENEEQ